MEADLASAGKETLNLILLNDCSEKGPDSCRKVHGERAAECDMNGRSHQAGASHRLLFATI
jgi:hypothetical protein